MGLLFLLRRSLHAWVSAVEGTYYSALPQDFNKKDVHLSYGVKVLTAFSPGSSKLKCHSIGSSLQDHWQDLSLPKEDGGAVKMVASGLSHALVLSDSRRVFGFGSNYFGQLGQYTATSAHFLTEVVLGLKHSQVKQVACGLDHSLFLLEDGSVLACGWAADGQTGIGSYNSDKVTSVKLKEKAEFLATCSDSSFALTAEGRVYAWGNNEYGQLGLSSEAPQVAVPEAVDCSLMDGPVTSIATGGAFTAFLTSEGSVYVCGNRNLQQEWGQRISPLLQQVYCGKEGRVVRLAAGLNFLITLLSSSTGLLWGKLFLPSSVISSATHFGKRFSICPDVLHLAWGPLGIAAITNSTTSTVLELK